MIKFTVFTSELEKNVFCMCSNHGNATRIDWHDQVTVMKHYVAANVSKRDVISEIRVSFVVITDGKNILINKKNVIQSQSNKIWG